MNRSRGFTVVELIVAILFALFAGALFFIQKRDIEIAKRDDQRKTAINAMYYNLEEVYWPANQHYPRAIGPDTLKAMDPALFTDPGGTAIGDPASDYRYEGVNCTDAGCQSYSLRADLEQEADFVKTPPSR